MNKRTWIYALSVLLFTLSSIAREFRTPLPAYTYPTYRVPCKIDEESKWAVDVWSAGFWRKADEALCKKDTEATTKKCPISQLIFSKADFQVQEAFANATAEDILNPFLTSTLSPRLKYTDSGIILGVDATKEINENWRIGIRGKIPFRNFKMKKTKSGGTGSSVFGGEAIDDVFQFMNETFNNTNAITYAARLDFISQLPMICTAQGLQFILVRYNNTIFTDINDNPLPPRITIRDIDITELPPTDTDKNPVTVIKRENGTAPTTFGIPSNIARALGVLSADGTQVNGVDLENDVRAQFGSPGNIVPLPVPNTGYTPLDNDRATQRQLWIVPSIDPATNQMVRSAIGVRNVINEVSACINTSPEALFEQCGISFDNQINRGIGDLDTEFFTQYFFNETCYVEGIFGVRIPTAEKIRTGKVFMQPLGNNGHTEVKIGIFGHLEPLEWIQCNSDISYSRVTRKRELVPAAFVGAQVKNLGPIVPAAIAWGYIVGHLDVRFRAPFSNKKHNLGTTAGYELYHKQKDSVIFHDKAQLDCLNIQQDLDANVLEKNTRVTSHKMYIEGSYYYVTSNDCSFGIFCGASWVVGGKNVPKEHDWNFGLRICL